MITDIFKRLPTVIQCGQHIFKPLVIKIVQIISDFVTNLILVRSVEIFDTITV